MSSSSSSLSPQLEQYYLQVCQREREAATRNNRLIESLAGLRRRTASISTRVQRLAQLKSQYEAYVESVYSKCETHSSFRQPESLHISSSDTLPPSTMNAATQARLPSSSVQPFAVLSTPCPPPLEQPYCSPFSDDRLPSRQSRPAHKPIPPPPRRRENTSFGSLSSDQPYSSPFPDNRLPSHQSRPAHKPILTDPPPPRQRENTLTSFGSLSSDQPYCSPFPDDQLPSRHSSPAHKPIPPPPRQRENTLTSLSTISTPRSPPFDQPNSSPFPDDQLQNLPSSSKVSSHHRKQEQHEPTLPFPQDQSPPPSRQRENALTAAGPLSAVPDPTPQPSKPLAKLSLDSTAKHIPLESKTEPILPESTAGPLPLDSTAESLPQVDSTAEPLPQVDSTAESLPRVDSTAESLPRVDSTAESLPRVDSTAESLPESTVQPLPFNSTAEPVLVEPTAEPLPIKPLPVKPLPFSTPEPLPRVDSKAGSLPRVDSTAESLPVIDSTAEFLPRVDSKAESLPRIDSTAESLPQIDSIAESLPRTDSTAESLPESTVEPLPFDSTAEPVLIEPLPFDSTAEPLPVKPLPVKPLPVEPLPFSTAELLPRFDSKTESLPQIAESLPESTVEPLPFNSVTDQEVIHGEEGQEVSGADTESRDSFLRTPPGSTPPKDKTHQQQQDSNDSFLSTPSNSPPKDRTRTAEAEPLPVKPLPLTLDSTVEPLPAEPLPFDTSDQVVHGNEGQEVSGADITKTESCDSLSSPPSTPPENKTHQQEQERESNDSFLSTPSESPLKGKTHIAEPLPFNSTVEPLPFNSTAELLPVKPLPFNSQEERSNESTPPSTPPEEDKTRQQAQLPTGDVTIISVSASSLTPISEMGSPSLQRKTPPSHDVSGEESLLKCSKSSEEPDIEDDLLNVLEGKVNLSTSVSSHTLSDSPESCGDEEVSEAEEEPKEGDDQVSLVVSQPSVSQLRERQSLQTEMMRRRLGLADSSEEESVEIPSLPANHVKEEEDDGFDF